MTKLELSIFTIALIFTAIGMLFFSIFSYYGYELLVLPFEEILQGHDMVLWLSLVASFIVFLISSLLAFAIKSEIKKTTFKLLILPAFISGMFVAGIPLFQFISSFFRNNA